MIFTHAARRPRTAARAIRFASAGVAHVTSTIRPCLALFMTAPGPAFHSLNVLSESPASSNFRLSTFPSLEYRSMNSSPIKFGTSGWRGLIADDFTFANVRLAVTAIAEHTKAKTKEPTILVGYDTRFYSEEFSQLAVDILQHHGIRTLLCETFTPTPAVAFEIMRRKLDGA